MLAIAALLAGKYAGLNWLDPLMGIVGAVIITRWGWGLVLQTAPVLLDASIDAGVKQRVEQLIESDGSSSISDLHIWKVSSQHYAAMVTVISHQGKSSLDYRQQLSAFPQLAHVTVETIECDDSRCAFNGSGDDSIN